jgi:hypothetical protein
MGGRAQDISLGFWAAIALDEVHHVIETIVAGHYTPGTVTAIPYIAFGALLLRAIVREHRDRVHATIPVSA